MSKTKKRKLSTQKQLNLVKDKMLDLMQDIRHDVEVPQFIYATQYVLSELAYDTAPSSNEATRMLLGSITTHLQHREDPDSDPNVTKLKKK
tara:strand:- start:288 stop:560 length:273 start_codon:yes stop_codon:yes gene_type:complete